MKKLLTLAFTMLLAASLSFAQAGGGITDTKTKGKEAPAASGKKNEKKGHKGGKKSKKSSSGGTTTAPK